MSVPAALARLRTTVAAARLSHRAAARLSRRAAALAIGAGVLLLTRPAVASLAPPEVPAALPPDRQSIAPSLDPAPWQPVPPDASQAGWLPVGNVFVLPAPFAPEPANLNPVEQAALPRTSLPYEDPGFFGLGGGIRWGQTTGGIDTGEPTSGVVTGRIAYKLGKDFSVSLRPSYIFGNRDLAGKDNNEGEFQMPLTMDFFRKALVSPYLGGGIATNTDSTSSTNPMLTGGVDINITRNIVLGFNVNYIFQTDIDDTDWQGMTLLYLRF
jgi:Outer membrane protein beta-barrel domain